MTYNHDKAKVTCPDCAREVERLRHEAADWRRYAKDRERELITTLEYLELEVDQLRTQVTGCGC